MVKTNREFYIIFQNRAGDKIEPQKQESPVQIGRVAMSATVIGLVRTISSHAGRFYTTEMPHPMTTFHF